MNVWIVFIFLVRTSVICQSTHIYHDKGSGKNDMFETKLTDITMNKKDALKFLIRHKRYSGEQHREAKVACSENRWARPHTGCFLEEMDEIYESMEYAREYMIDYKCPSNCEEGCITTNYKFYEIKKLAVRCKRTCDRNLDKCNSETERCVDEKYNYKCVCKDGYRRPDNDDGQGDCKAICDEKIGKSACTIDYDQPVKLRTDVVKYRSGGTCYEPERCKDCNRGSYPNGPYCSVCKAIPHCNDRSCTDGTNSQCSWCEGEVKPTRYWRAYKQSPDKSKCLKACSWRSDSRRCYPGYCKDELVNGCKCTKGFGGYQCDIILEDVKILYREIRMYDSNDNKVSTPADPNGNKTEPDLWTNNDKLIKAEAHITLKYVPTGIPPKLTDEHYVTKMVYGITHAQINIEHRHGIKSLHKPQPITCIYSTPYGHRPLFDIQNCGWTKENRKQIDVSRWKFGHDHTLTFSFFAKNGGYINYINRDTSNTHRADLYGRTISRSYNIRWDLIKPFHSCASKQEACNDPPVDCIDITEKPNIKLVWTKWNDQLSGIEEYQCEIFELNSFGNQLKHGKLLPCSDSIPLKINQYEVTLPDAGMYAIKLTAFDKAGNRKSARCLTFYDNKSTIDIKNGKRITVKQSSAKTNYAWVSVDDTKLHVSWPDRFINKRHQQHKWLDRVKRENHIDMAYDDVYGRRQVSEIPNANGIVKFKIKYDIYGGSSKQHFNFIPTSDVLSQSETIHVLWKDGYKLDITVRAFDIFSKFKDDTATVYKDVSPPAIEDLWLTKGDRVNISVHSIEEFAEMTIEWKAFDYHSGLNQVHWRLFNNYTGIEEHGNSAETAQGQAKNITECNTKYDDEPRGAACYCTKFHGCYHQNFNVKPRIVKDSGITPGKEKGVHDSDYYIEVTVINNALLKTTKTIKITIDISPPHEGYVHDGVKGFPEIDFQQDLQLKAYWEGFFDRESGVDFYYFMFSDHCLTNQEMNVTDKKQKTYNTFASYNAPMEGKYFISVIAVNRASDSSNVVCSDGVTITTTTPFVINLAIDGVKSKDQLFNDSNGTLWLVDQQLIRHKIENDTCLCSEIIAYNDVSMLPEGNSTDKIGVTSCDVDITTDIVGIFPKLSMISWTSGIDERLIHDYEIGLSSTKSSKAPDIYSFHSTKHHRHYHLRHPNLVDGKEFYVIFKTISKSSVEGFQHIGPFITDNTPPLFNGESICLKFEDDDHLVARWSMETFEDQEDPYPLTITYSIGEKAYEHNTKEFIDIRSAGPCERTAPPTCTAVSINTLHRSLHSGHDYYITLKVTNTVGLATTVATLPYRHYSQYPFKGVVFDILPDDVGVKGYKDILDIDFTSNKTSIGIEWNGFQHQHQEVIYHICVGTQPGHCDTVPKIQMNSTARSHLFRNLTLKLFKKYFTTVEAVASAGSINMSSDGFTVISMDRKLSGVILNDGTNCSVEYTNNQNTSHHKLDTKPFCSTDIDWQISTSVVSAYWSIPDEYMLYTKEAYLAIEEKSVFGDFWKMYQAYTYVGKHNFKTFNDLNLLPGHAYRTILKLCIEELCFPSIKSNGFVVLHNYPKTGSMHIIYDNMTTGEQEIKITFEKMYDPDIEDHEEAVNVVDLYEWAVGDHIGIHTKWNHVKADNSTNVTHISFTIPLNNSIDFSKCRKVFVRGYNKVRMWSIISSEIKQCNVNDGDAFIIPKLVIDAIGKQERNGDGSIRNGIGHDIFLGLNEDWTEPDIDYTPYKNVLSAVWPKLRHSSFIWSLIEVNTMDSLLYYKDDIPVLPDPCSHPNSIQCGNTENRYINVFFGKDHQLQHRKRYRFCVHAKLMYIPYEQWTEKLDEVKTCSDGIMVDLTPPIPGKVWIGNSLSTFYQYSTSDVYVSWESFRDVEEINTAVHSSGIKEYFVGIGSTKGGTDIFPYTNVGVVNHYTIHHLRLQNGHMYFASVKAFDLTGKSSTSTSQGIKIDNTPPVKTANQIKIQGRHISNLTTINACWRDVFTDTESGISHYMWGIGSRKGHDDIVPFSKTTFDCGVSTKHEDFTVYDGHAYFVSIKAINRALLMTSASSYAYIYDQSPPLPGYVYDVTSDDSSVGRKDIDYQTTSNVLSCYWGGFNDPHSTIKMYYISIGSCRNCQDVLQRQDVGIISNFTLRHIHLTEGFRYYTTITACNTADLCTSVTSDGVIIDTSPPTVGVVQDGVDMYDMQFQSTRHYIAGKWYGFTDPQSGLYKISWRAGTKPGNDDIVQSTHLPVSEVIVKPNISTTLPVGKRIFLTVRVYNKAGLYSEASSNGFIVDVTPPVFNSKPYLDSTFGSVRPNTIVFRSSFKIKWSVEDNESFIERQYMSLSSHQGGNFNATTQQVSGIVRDYTFSELNLHDGASYIVNVIVCNQAKLCSASASEQILVDSSPPTPGMFAIHTDHAANLRRHIEGWMTWSRYKLWLSWLGFTDIHTGIDKYFVTVGSSYMKDDLNEDAETPAEFVHNSSGLDKGDEGFVQTFEINTQNLRRHDHVFVSIWARNNVGLQSQMIHSQFMLVPGGTLHLIRRCSAITCLGHCVCSSQNGRCSLPEKSCNDIKKDNQNTLLHVYDVTDLQSSTLQDVSYTPSNLEIAAKWQIVQAQGLPPLWYEWSVGLTLEDSPEGVFDNINDIVWWHAGKSNQAFLSLKQGKSHLKESVSYSFFIRAWYSDSTFAMFKSDGVIILSKSLAKTQLKGSKVCEQIPGHWKKDIDYIKPGHPFTIKWTNVFIDAKDIIQRFNVYLSTFPGGYDVHDAAVSLPGTVTTYNISRIPLTPGVMFFSNVVAYSYSGIHSISSSDGITVDIVPPTTGYVKDGTGLHDIDYQKNPNLIEASWHGFSDRDSVIMHYMWCVQSIPETKSCDILEWENVGLHTSVSRNLNQSLIFAGMRFQSKVYAVDIVGHKSPVVISNGVTVDTTGPLPTKMVHIEENIALNPSFEQVNGQFDNWDGKNVLPICEQNNQPLYWNVSDDSCVTVFKTDTDLAYDGRAFIYILGQITQQLSNLTTNHLYRVTFVSAHLPLQETHMHVANKEGYIGIGDEYQVFLTYTKQELVTLKYNRVTWQYHTFYFRPMTDTLLITIGTYAVKTGILFDDLKVHPVTYDTEDKSEMNFVHKHFVTVYDWSSVHSSWHFVDPESPVIEYTWAIGYAEGSTEVQDFTSVGTRTFGINYNITLIHNSVIHITVIATNAAGLMTKVYADGLKVDLTPPNIIFVNDGQGPDVAAQTESEIAVNWEVEDIESDIQYCEWAIGYQPYGNEVQLFEILPSGINQVSKIFDDKLISSRTIYVTIRCKNYAGLQTSLSSDGVAVSKHPPNATDAQVEIIALSDTEYHSRNNYQSNNNTIRLKWTGFTDIIGLDSYLISLRKEDNEDLEVMSRSIMAEKLDISYCIINQLELQEGNYTVLVKAVNKMFVRSNSIKAVLTISSDKPELYLKTGLQITTDNRDVTVSWNGIFSSTQSIVYEVSAGSVSGSADIIQWQETKNTFIEFHIPSQIQSVSGLVIHLTVRGINSNGLNYILKDVLKIH